jgi:MFS family permease
VQSVSASPAGTAVATKLTRNQVRGFWAAWAGWCLDGMDSFIYALVLVPALRDLLPRSGIAATTGALGYYGGILFALFLVGWGLSLLWGPVGDRFGRVRTLMLTILCYSLFTFASALVTNVWQLAAFRLLGGIGIGGEWTLGGTFVAEEWPEDRRKMGAGFMHTGYYFGVLIAALLNASVGAHYGWRAMFAVGGIPALLVIFIRKGVHEPKRWKPAESATKAMALLFSPEYRRRTLLNSSYLLVSIIGLWAGSVYSPSALTFLAGKAGLDARDSARMASLGTIILSVGTVLGCLAVPLLAERWGRRWAQAFLFTLMLVSIALGFGWAFYLKQDAIAWFLALLFIMGFGGANHAMYSLWLPEQYRTECRASAFGFTTSVGRFVGAIFTFLVGAGVAHYQTIGIPVALTSLAFVAGLILLPFGVETRGQPLPE